jgi:hypothetical protein
MTRSTLSLSVCALIIGMSLTACGGGDEEEKAPPLTCADVDLTQAAQDMPEKGETVTLSGVYAINSRYIYDGGEKVTIEPGTVFIMGPDSRIYTGWRSDPASIFAKGTAEQPILFCGSKAEEGHWQDIQLLTGTTTDSYLEHVRIENAGGSSTSDAASALYMSQPLRLSNVTVVGSSKIGMTLEGLREGSENLVISGSKTNPLNLKGDSAITNLPEGDYTGNGEDVALVEGYSDTKVHFKSRGIPYRQMNEVIRFGPAGGAETWIRLDAGVEYQFCQDCSMQIGWRGDPGAIYAEGTAEEPVVFTSSQDAPKAGDWDGIELLTGMNSDSKMSHVQLRYAGKSDGQALLIAGGKGTIDNLTVADSAGAGVKISGERDAGLTLGAVTYESTAMELVEE